MASEGQPKGAPAPGSAMAAHDEALAFVAQAEAAKSTGWLGELGSSLRASSKGMAPDVAAFVAGDAHACELYLDPAFGHNARRVPFENWQPELFDDSLRTYFEARADRSGRLDARARYNEILWLRWKAHDRAQIARAQYLELTQAEPLDETGNPEHIDWLERAGQLSVQLNNEREATAAVMRAEIRRALTTKNLGYVCFPIDHLPDLIAIDAADAGQLATDLVAAADASEQNEFWRKRSLLEAAALLRSALGEKDESKALWHRVGATIEAEAAASGSGLAQLAHLTEAAEIYKNYGFSEDAQRLKADQVTAGRAAQAEMVTVEGKTQVDRATFERAAEALSVWSNPDEAAFLKFPIEVGFWPSRAKMEKQRLNLQAAAPFLSLVSHRRLDRDARNQPDPDDPAELLVAQLDRTTNQDTFFRTAFLDIQLDYLRRERRWTAAGIVRALRVLGDDVADACEAGIYAYEGGSAWVALHVLTPQLERLLRLMGEAAGASISSYTTTTGIRWKDMGELLKEPAIRTVLSEDIALALEAVLVSPYGANIRNNVAHGAVDPAGSRYAEATIVVMAILTLALGALLSRGQAQVESPAAGVAT